MTWKDKPALVIYEREIGSIEARELANAEDREIVYWKGGKMQRIRPNYDWIKQPGTEPASR